MVAVLELYNPDKMQADLQKSQQQIDISYHSKPHFKRRVDSNRTTQFRIWATKVLKSYMLDGVWKTSIS